MKSTRWQDKFLSHFKFLFFAFTLLNAMFAFAGPTRTTYQAKIIKPDGHPLEASNVNFKFTILDPSGSCIIFAETYSSVNMTSTGGLISFSLGSGVKTFPVSGTTFEQIFSNITPNIACDTGGAPAVYTPLANDARKIVMQFHDGGGWQTLPAMNINAVPYAMYANDSQKFNGLAPSDFVQVSTVPTCTASQALRYTGSNFQCVATGDSGSVTSGSVITALGYTPADDANLSTVTNYATNVSSTVFSVSSTVSSLSNSVSTLQSSVAASFAAIVNSQWITSGTTISYNAGRVGVGTDNPAYNLHVMQSVSGSTQVTIDAYSGTPGLYFRKANGTVSAPLAVSNTSSLLEIAAVGHGQTGFIASSAAKILMVSEEDWTDATAAASIRFHTRGSSTTAPSLERMRIDKNGNVGIGITSAITKLDVSGGVRISMEAATCAASYAGTLRYNAGNVEYCNGTTWSAFGVAGAGITLLNGSASGSQTFATGITGTVFNISSANGVHTFNIPLAASGSVTAGLLSNTDYVTFTNKIDSSVSGSFTLKANNLSDLASATVARANLGLGSLALLNFIDLSGSQVSGTLAAARLPAFSGDVFSSVGTAVLTLANVGAGVTSGTQYTKVTVDGKGRVTSGTQLASSDVTIALGYTPANSATTVSSQWTTSGTTINYMTGDIGIGTASPGTKLEVAGQIKITGGTPGSGKVLTSDASGLAIWADVSTPSNSVPIYQVRVTTTANITLSGNQTIDGVSVATGDRVLVKNQTASAENGVYVAAAGAWSRATDMDSWAETLSYSARVTEGNRQVGMIYVSSANVGGTLDTTSLNWSTAGATNGATMGAAVGNLALTSNTTGANHAALGNNALRSNTTGNLNTGVGANALQSNATGNSNTGVGANALQNNTASNNTAVGSNALQINTTGTANTAMGHQSLSSNLTGGENAAFGYYSLTMNTTGIANTATGRGALYSSSTGHYNTANGHNSLYSNTTGGQNTAAGANALYENTTGGLNTATGYSALYSNKAKNESTAVGYYSMRYADDTTTAATTYNTAIGAYSLRGSTTPANNTGTKNTALGYSALSGVTSGSNNIGVGYNAGSAITTGSNNVVIGSNTGSTIATASNNIIIADGAGNERIRIDNAGNVGIGTSAPTAKLHLVAGTSSTAALKFTSGTLLTSPQSGTMEYDGTNFYLTDSTNARRAIATGSSAGTIDNASTINSTENITMVPVGSVVVSSTTASANSATGALVVKGGLGVAGNIYSSGTILTSSNIEGAGVKSKGSSAYLEMHDTDTAYGSNPQSALVFRDSGNSQYSFIGPSNGSMIWNSWLPIELDTTGGVDLYVSMSGKVGIGTSAPTSNLDISAGTIADNSSALKVGGIVSAPISGTYGSSKLSFNANFVAYGAGPRMINLYPTAQVDGHGIGLSNGLTEFYSNGSFGFFVRPNRADVNGTYTSTEVVRVNSSGNMGIGTTTPLAKLQVGGNVLIDGTSNDSANFILRDNSTSGTWNIDSYSGRLRIFTEAGIDAGGGTERMTLTTSGNVGIGTVAPGARLHVATPANGGVNNRLVMGNSNSDLIDVTNLSGDSFLDHSVSARFFATTSTTLTRAVTFKIDGAPSVSGTNLTITEPLAFWVQAGDSSFGGNLGVGTTTPSSRLTVKDSLAITSTAGIQYLLMGNQDSAGTSHPSIIRAANGNLEIGSGSSWAATGDTFTSKFWFGDDGKLGVGTDIPSGKLSNIPTSAVNTNPGDANGTGENANSFNWGTAASGYSAVVTNNSLSSGANGLNIRTLGTTSSYTILAAGVGVSSTANSYDVLTVKANKQVGINTSTPLQPLTVNGGFALQPAANDHIYMEFYARTATPTTRSGWFGYGTVATNIMQITNEISGGHMNLATTGTGKVGINQTSPSYALDVNGTLRGYGITDSSDVRLKKDIQPLDLSLEKILQVEGVSYYWKDKEKSNKKQIGFIAQQLEKIYPELVETDKFGMKSVNYSHLVAPLVEAVKSIYARLTNVEAKQEQQSREIANVKAENVKLKERLDRLEKALNEKK